MTTCLLYKNLTLFLKINNLNTPNILGFFSHFFSKMDLNGLIIQEKNLTTYSEFQTYLSTINEKEAIRKSKGVYYTPTDIIDFIIKNSLKLSHDNLAPNLLNTDIDVSSNDDINSFVFNKSIFEPTCGTGEFLLEILDLKCQLMIKQYDNIDIESYIKIVKTLHGNDINPFSIFITKLRVLLYTLEHFGESYLEKINKYLDKNFKVYNFVDLEQVQKSEKTKKYDFIVGNPPYVEDSKSGLDITNKYGNIYANVVKNATFLLKNNGVMGFIIPISFVSTPRMARLRNDLIDNLESLHILSYSDRPDCLFVGVHQKLCVILGKKTNNSGSKKANVFTSNYQYWYKNERESLFKNQQIVANPYLIDKFIPKLGNQLELNLYEKIASFDDTLMDYLAQSNLAPYQISLNMRCTYWIKAFLNCHAGGEYKQFYFTDEKVAHFMMCLLNSSLFWWYWTVVSDCWHITQKEFAYFKIPNLLDISHFSQLAIDLEDKLEQTKVYVGTKQTDYEYKHKFCLDEIHVIDDAINHLYQLTDEQSQYIKKFALKYRVNTNVKSN